MKEYVVKPGASRDVDNITDWIKKDSLVSARKFLNCVRQTLILLSHNPKMGSLHYADITRQDIRMLPVKNFSYYLIFYVEHSHAYGYYPRTAWKLRYSHAPGFSMDNVWNCC